MNSTLWAEHLGHPLVLVGFALVLVFGVVRTLLRARARAGASRQHALLERVVHVSLTLATLTVVAGLILAVLGAPPQPTPAGEKPTAHSEPSITVDRSGRGMTPAAPTTVEPVPSSQSRAAASGAREAPGAAPTPDTGSNAASQARPGNVTQSTRGDKSPAVVSSGDVKISY